MKIQIEPLRNTDAHLIPKLIKSGMDQDIFALTIFSARGYENYLKNLLLIPENNRTVKLYGAFVDGQLAGYSEWRIFEKSIFLNNIYVFPEFQGIGIGKILLIKHGRKLMNKYEKMVMSLDVFENNAEALRWYQRIGFEKENVTHWYLGEQTSIPISDRCYIEHYPKAIAEQEAYDFSMFTCSTNKGVYQIGRIKNHYYRLTDSKGLNDLGLLHCLYKLAPNRKILLLTNEIPSSPASFRLACKSYRMSLDLN